MSPRTMCVVSLSLSLSFNGNIEVTTGGLPLTRSHITSILVLSLRRKHFPIRSSSHPSVHPKPPPFIPPPRPSRPPLRSSEVFHGSHTGPTRSQRFVEATGSSFSRCALKKRSARQRAAFVVRVHLSICLRCAAAFHPRPFQAPRPLDARGSRAVVIEACISFFRGYHLSLQTTFLTVGLAIFDFFLFCYMSDTSLVHMVLYGMCTSRV